MGFFDALAEDLFVFLRPIGAVELEEDGGVRESTVGFDH